MTFELLPFVPPWVLAAGAVLAAGVLALVFRGMRVTATSRQRLLLVGLRALVVLLVLLALAGPVLTYEQDDPERSRSLALLVDTSRSMSVTDAPDGASRLAQAVRLADRLRDACEDDFDVRLYRFDATLRPAGEDPATADGDATNLRRAVERVATGAGRAATVVVLSDGIETGPRDGPPLASPVHAVAVGTGLTTAPNLGFSRFEVPEQVDLGTKGRLVAEVVASGSPAFLARLAEVPVTLVDGGVERVVATLDLSRGGTAAVEAFVEADRPGFRAVALALPASAAEATVLDNRREGIVEARDPDLRVLYVSSRLDQEFRTIRREVAEMAGADLASVIELSPGRFQVQGERDGDGLARGLPQDPARLARFHAVVLGGFPAEALPPASQAALCTFVEGGGGLVWLAAEDGFGRGGWSRSPLAALSPLAFGASDPPPLPGPVAVLLAPEAASHPLARGLEAVFAALAHPLAVEGLYRFGSPLPGSTVVLESRGPEGVDLPALACRDVGQGRVVVLASSTWFRWRTVGGAPAAAYATLWRQVLRHAASRAEERSRLSLSADRERYEPGDVAVLTAVMRDADFRPAAGGTVGATLLRLDGREAGEVRFTPSATEVGTWTASVPLPGAGAVRVAGWATDGTGNVGQREVLLRTAGSREGERVARDRESLRRLAESTGGRVFAPEEVDDLAARLTARDRAGRTFVTRSLFHDGFLGFGAIFLAALAEWLVRRHLRRI